jgi:LysM repeat protein
MKQFIAIFLLSFLQAATFAQTPVYLMFDWSCIDQLDYRSNNGGEKVTVFNYYPTANDQYLLTAGEGIISSVNIPAGTIKCSDFRLNDLLVDVVNRHTRQVYIVQQTTAGTYMLTPIISAVHIARAGSVYKFYMTDCSFAADTNSLSYNQNLIFSGDASVYFTGYKLCDCRLQYSFEREPGRTNAKRADWDFIPGIGIVSDRSGTTNAEKESRGLTLVRINNQLLDDYLATRCQRRPPLRTTLSKWAGNPLPEPTRETYPVGTIPSDLTPDPRSTGGAAPVTYSNVSGSKQVQPVYVTQPTNCSESFVYGYHIVQRGETMNTIARAYNTDIKSLCMANGITNPNRVAICSKLRIPEVRNGITTPGPVAQRQFNWGDITVPAPAPTTYNTNYDYYNDNYANNSVPNTPAGQAATSASTQYYHIVQPGEYLYGIAKLHGLTETQIRRYNGYTSIGAITLYPGDQLWLVDPNEAYRSGQSLPQQPRQYNNTNRNPAPSGPVFIESPVDGNYIREEQENQQFAPRGDYYNNAAQVPPTPQQYNNNQYQDNRTNKNAPTHFNEHIVKYGETIGSIAQSYGLSVRDLIKYNEKTEKEALIPGQKVLIPRWSY